MGYAFGALLRRNVIYRKRRILGSLLEMLLPVAFIGILVAIKASLKDTEGFNQKEIAEKYRDFNSTLIPFTFSDYVTAIQADRVCYKLPKEIADQIPEIPGYETEFSDYLISGLNYQGFNWQVPFVKCDSRNCEESFENAKTKYCEYPVLALAPGSDTNNELSLERVKSFKKYIYETYPLINGTTNDNIAFDYDFVKTFASASEMEEYVKSPNYGTEGYPKIGLGVIFTNDDTNNPKSYDYKLRVNSTNFNAPEEQARPGSKTTPNTNVLFESFAKDDNVCSDGGPGSTSEGGRPMLGEYDESCTAQYIYNAALPIQRLVHDFILVDSGAKANGYWVAEHGVSYNPFPTPAYIEDGFYAAIEGFAPLLILLGMLYPVAAVTRALTFEKELRQRELMKMMSVTQTTIGWSWFVSYLAFHIITAILCTVVSKSLYENSEVGILFVFWLLTLTAAIIIFGMLIASFITRAVRATLIGLLVFFVGYFLTLIVSYESSSLGAISACALHPVAAYSFGLQEIGRLEDLGVGLTRETMSDTDSKSGYTFSDTLRTLLFDCLLWGVVTWYLNRVTSSDYGQPLPWYFPFTSSYWCPGSARAPNTSSSGSETDDEDVAAAHEESEFFKYEKVAAALKEQEKDGRSIEIRGLRKQFGEKTAVDGLNLSMYSGQITALLGHNGAGKTTTIGMLTGMIAPTDGYALVAGKDIRTQLPQIRKEIGVCLQHDCLFPLLTVKEHIQFFARIKGLYATKSRDEAEASIKTAMEDVALLEKRNSLAPNLSGGQKRKLSVAIAFCGDSKTVLLDEPTSGMDPFSRRFTWNVIRQYRQDRCIILTTHFMDEADILGDRIAIMAEGRLRCSGSPLFLKKAYGVGYQLTIEKKTKQGHQAAIEAAPSPPEIREVPTSSFDESVDQSVEYWDDGIPVEEELNGEVPASQATSKNVFAQYQDDAYGSKDTIAYDSIDDKLMAIVTGAVKDAKVLSNIGTELSFQLPLDESSNFRTMFNKLDKEVDSNRIVTYGVGITTLDEVFLLVARGEYGEHTQLASAGKSGKIEAGKGGPESTSYRSKMELENDAFSRHVGALFQKRALIFKRDKKAWCCSTIFPSIFVLIGIILFTFAPARDLEPLTLTLEDYNPKITNPNEIRNPIPFNNGSSFTCRPGNCVFSLALGTLNLESGETYSYCGEVASVPIGEKCTIDNSSDYISSFGTDYGAVSAGADVSSIQQASLSEKNTSDDYAGSQYGAIYYTHQPGSVMSDGTSYNEEVITECQNGISQQDYMDPSICDNYGGIGYVVSYNFTAIHAAPLYQALADEALVREALDDDEFSITVTMDPLPFTQRESEFGKAEDAFTAWFLVVLSFPFISGSFATFVVAERLSKAKHLQTVAGVKPSAYWLSTYLWDIMNYQLPCWITIALMYIFKVETFTTSERGVVGGFIALLILFGPASAAFTYIISFFFKSPSQCNLFVIIFNFLIGMAGPLTCFILRLIGSDPGNPRDNLVSAADIIEWCLRWIPAFCLGKGLFNTINVQTFVFLAGKEITVWDPSVALYEVIFLAGESIVYILLVMQIDRWSTNPSIVAKWKAFTRFLTCKCGNTHKAFEEGITVALPDDEDVAAEAERVVSGDAVDELVVVQKLSKQYPNGKVAVNNISFGIPTGECFGLLGINGAGKTSTMAMLTAEFPPTEGDAFLAGYSVTKEPEQTRRRIGYCPQFDAHFQNMSGREHVELYAAIKGVPRNIVKEAAAAKLAEVGLSEFDSDRLAANYSGGMKRKLSVATATIGQPQIVFLDEPSTGMDPVARRDMWKVISDMVIGEGLKDEEKTSVILTTHSMEEAEALCPRISIMANGKLRCIGSAQHLKTRFGKGYQVELKIREAEDEDQDYKDALLRLARGTGPINGEDTEAGLQGLSPEDIFFNLQEAHNAVRSLCDGDDFLVNIISADNPTGYIVYKNASSGNGCTLDELASFATDELRMRRLMQFFEATYPNCVLRERQENKARYEVSSVGLRISSLFTTIEDNKGKLMLSDYGVSQTTLEQVFNMHAAEAEALKQGQDDG